MEHCPIYVLDETLEYKNRNSRPQLRKGLLNDVVCLKGSGNETKCPSISRRRVGSFQRGPYHSIKTMQVPFPAACTVRYTYRIKY